MSASAKTTPATDLALIAVFAALIAAFSLTPAIPITGGVPITLQTLAVVLAGLVLGPWRGFLATLLYLAVGFAPREAQDVGKLGTADNPRLSVIRPSSFVFPQENYPIAPSTPAPHRV